MEYSSSIDIDCQRIPEQRKHFFKSALTMKENIVSGVKTIYKGVFYGTGRYLMESDVTEPSPSFTPLEMMSSHNSVKDNVCEGNSSCDSADDMEHTENICIEEENSQNVQKSKSVKEVSSDSNQATMDTSVRSHTSLVREILELSKHRKDTAQSFTNDTTESVIDIFALENNEIRPWLRKSECPMTTGSEESEIQIDCTSDDSNSSFRTAVSDLNSLDLCAVSDLGDSPSFNQFPPTKCKAQEPSWAMKRFCNQQNCSTESIYKNTVLNSSQQSLRDSFRKKNQIISHETDINGVNSSLCHLSFSFSEQDFQFGKEENTTVNRCSTPTFKDMEIHPGRKPLFVGELSTDSQIFKTREVETNLMEAATSSSKLGDSLIQFGPKRFKTIESKIKTTGKNPTTKYVNFSEQYPNSDCIPERSCDVNSRNILHSTLSSPNSDKMKRKLIDYFPDYASEKSNVKRRRLNENNETLLAHNPLHSRSIVEQACQKRFENGSPAYKNKDHKQFKKSIMGGTEEFNPESGTKNASLYLNTIFERLDETNGTQQSLLSETKSFNSTKNQCEGMDENDDFDKNITSANQSCSEEANQIELMVNDVTEVKNRPNEPIAIPHALEKFTFASNHVNALELTDNAGVHTQCPQELDFQREPETVYREPKPCMAQCQSKNSEICKSRNDRKRRKKNRLSFVREKPKRTQEWNIARKGSSFNKKASASKECVTPLILRRPPRVFKTKSLKPLSKKLKTNPVEKISKVRVEMQEESSPTCSEAQIVQVSPKDSFRTDQNSLKTSPFPLIADNVKRVFELLSPKCRSAPLTQCTSEQSNSMKESFTSTDEADFSLTLSKGNGPNYLYPPTSPYGNMKLSKVFQEQVTEKWDGCVKEEEVASTHHLSLPITKSSIERVSRRGAKMKALNQMKEQLTKRKRQTKTIRTKGSTSQEMHGKIQTDSRS